MTNREKFKLIVAQYCDRKPAEIAGSDRFREDLGFSSLDFMSFLGELEDEFDTELDTDEIVKVRTIEEAFSLLDERASA